MDLEDVIDRLWWATEEYTDGCYLTMQRVRRGINDGETRPCGPDADGAEWEAQLRDHALSVSDDPDATALGRTPREAKEALLEVMRGVARARRDKIIAAILLTGGE